MNEENLPKPTEDAYADLVTQATTPEEAQALEEMRQQDLKERQESIKDIANRPLPEISPNGIALLDGEDPKDGDEPPEYGQGGPRAQSNNAPYCTRNITFCKQKHPRD